MEQGKVDLIARILRIVLVFALHLQHKKGPVFSNKKASVHDKKIPHCKLIHSTVRKSHRTLTVTIHQKDFLIKMIAKLKRVQSNAQQNTSNREPNNQSNK